MEGNCDVQYSSDLLKVGSSIGKLRNGLLDILDILLEIQRGS